MDFYAQNLKKIQKINKITDKKLLTEGKGQG